MSRALFFLLISLSLASAESGLRPVLLSFVDQNIAPGVVALVANRDGVVAMGRAVAAFGEASR